MNKKRVVVTGMGLVSCFGNDIDVFYDRLVKGHSGVGPLTVFPCEDFPTRFAASVNNFDPGEYIDKKQARRVDPYLAYTMVAGKRALEDAKLGGDALNTLNKQRCGVLVGSGMGGMKMFYDGVSSFVTKGVHKLTPFFVPYIITNMGGAVLAIDLGFMGPNYSISTACATGTFSIISAANHIRRGDADLMICGGVEAAMTPISLGGFVALKALSERNDDPQRASRPWDRQRDGFVMGEGCGAVVLESLEHALARGAPILAEYLGGGISCDAFHMTSTRDDGSGIATCINYALQDAEIVPEQVNYINAHATSTIVGDLAEIRGIKLVFGEHRKKMRMNATKSLIGHCLGAAGGVEFVAVVKAIQTGILHPTINLENPEPELDMDVVANQAQKFDVDVAISNSFGFGGHNACVAVGRYHP
jgi:3-oxoacyl-[acyl-carrier-protein] synthase II